MGGGIVLRGASERIAARCVEWSVVAPRRIIPIALSILAALAAACGQRVPAAGPLPEVPVPAATTAPLPRWALTDEVPTPPEDPLEPYRGLGAWVDLFDDALWGDPEGTVAGLASRGVRTLFLETGSYRFRGPIKHPAAAGRFLEAAHGHGMQVVAWYVPDFAHLERDLSWSIGTIGFRSPNGHAFDSFALDIEVTKVADHAKRAERMLRLSEDLRAFVGPGYPLGAIVPSPLRGEGYWPILPVDRLAALYDVILPMAYWTHQASGEAEAYDYIARSVQLTRDAAGRADVPIHIIGGIADPAGPDEIRGFARAVTEAELIGASVYDVATTGEDDWAVLAGLR